MTGVNADVVGWMDAARAGDRDAFGLLYSHYHGVVHRFVSTRIFNRHLAEDITADTFTRALGRVGGFEWQGRDPGAWFITIARNIISDHVKSARCQREVLTGTYLVAEYNAEADHDADPARIVARADEIDMVRAAIQCLPTATQRAAMRHRHVAGLSTGETAALMGRHAGAVKSLCDRATTRMRKALDVGPGRLS